MISERWQTNEMSPVIALVYNWESFQLCVVLGRETQPEFSGLPELRRWSWEPGETHVGRSHRTELERGARGKDLPSGVFN